jgi:tRNA threonylcarbamoyladenosine biosynthesis protein TsaB
MGRAMNLLAIDTSSSGTLVVARSASGALAERRHVPGERERPAHTTLGLVLAAEALEELGLAWADLGRVGIGIGPGSFTGLRAGLSAAAGLARRLDIPLVGVTATELLAAGAVGRADERPLLTVVDGRRRELFVERWTGAAPAEPNAGADAHPLALRSPSGIAAVPRAELAERLGSLYGWLVVGDGALLEREALLALGADVPDPQDPVHALGARPFAELAAAGVGAPADEVRPAYGRGADAIPTSQRGGNRPA